MKDLWTILYDRLLRQRVTLSVVSVHVLSYILVVISSGRIGSAQTIVDVQSEVNRSLQSAGLVVKKRTVQRTERTCRDVPACRGECTRTVCSDHVISVEENYQDYLHLTGISATKVSPLSFGKPFVNSLPERFELENFRSKNCADTPQTVNTVLQKSVQESRSISINHTISTGTALTAGLSFSFAGFGTGNASVNVTKTISLSDTNEQGESESVARSFSVNQAVPALTELWGEMRIVESNLSVAFTTTAIVDGPVDANENGISSASQVLGEAQRTFLIEGTLFATAASDANITFFSRHLDKTIDCTGNDKLETAAFDGSARLLAMMKKTNVDKALTSPLLPLLSLSVLQNPQQEPNVLASLSSKNPPTLKGDLSDTPSFAAAGQHQCQSGTDIGHSCQVSGFGYNDCNEAFFQLKANDCCASTQICGPDPLTGTVKCQLGGTSIGFTINYCMAQ